MERKITLGTQNYQLVERDVHTVLSVYKYRYLSTSQIQRLHFHSRQMAYRRLRILTTTGYLKNFSAPNIPEQIFYLDTRGADLVAEYLHFDTRDLNWTPPTRTPKDYYFLRHFLRLNDFRIILSQGCERSPAIELVGFIPEYYGEKIDSGGVKKYIRDFVCDVQDISHNISHTPDGVFALQKNEKPALFFLEIDRGTEILTNEEKGFLKAIRFYLNYFLDDKYQRYQDDFHCEPFKAFRTLIVTTSEERLAHMRQAVSGLNFVRPQAKRFIWLGTFDQVTAESVFEPMWRSADVKDENRYRIG